MSTLEELFGQVDKTDLNNLDDLFGINKQEENNLEFYEGIHQKLASKCENFITKTYVSRPQNQSNKFIKGRITDEIKNLDLSKHLKTQFYIVFYYLL